MEALRLWPHPKEMFLEGVKHQSYRQADSDDFERTVNIENEGKTTASSLGRTEGNEGYKKGYQTREDNEKN